MSKYVQDPRTDRLRMMLVQFCYWYYVQCQPMISDQTYDKLLKELEGMERAFGAHPESPTQKIWGDRANQYPTWAKSEARVSDIRLSEWDQMRPDNERK